MRFLALFCVFLFLTGCGLKQDIASEANGSGGNGDSGDSGPRIEDAVFIKEVTTNHKGTRVQCRLNPILIDLEEEIPVFIEFNGEEIQRAVFKNEKAPINFAFYNPPEAGFILCVAEYAGALFESQGLLIKPQ